MDLAKNVLLLLEPKLLVMCERIGEVLKIEYSVYQFIKNGIRTNRSSTRWCMALHVYFCLTNWRNRALALYHDAHHTLWRQPYLCWKVCTVQHIIHYFQRSNNSFTHYQWCGFKWNQNVFARIQDGVPFKLKKSPALHSPNEYLSLKPIFNPC